MINVGIIHYTGKDRGTLPATIASLHRAGITSVTVFSDAGEHGPTRNLIRALDHLRQDTRHELVLVVDDDLVFNEAFRAAIKPRADYGKAMSLWTIEQNIPHEDRHKRGWVPVSPHLHLWGGAVVMDRYSVRDIVKVMLELVAMNPELATKPDATLFEAIRINELDLYFHIPSLADHIGTDESTIGNTHHNGETKGYLYGQ